ncbi:MAG: Ig-like domain-containing protein [Clostridium sp.]|nr:Ig-like domain-containing protein [Clostridium sp.]
MERSSKVTKWYFSMLLMAVMVAVVLPGNLVHAKQYNFDAALGAFGSVDYNEDDWEEPGEDDYGTPKDLDTEYYKQIVRSGGNHVYVIEIGQGYVIDAYHEDDGSGFLLYGKEGVESLRVEAEAPGGRFYLTKKGELYLLAGNANTREINLEYGDLIHNVQVEDGNKSPTITELPTGGYAIEVPEGSSILLDGEKKPGGNIYYIPATKENEKQAAKDEVKEAADKEKEKIDKIPNLSDTEKADAKKEITDAADSADTKIDAATTKKEINDAISDAQKTMSDAVSKAENLSKNNEEQNKQIAESFIKDNLTDESGKIITTVTEKNIINILNAKEKWDSLSQDVKNIINQLLQEAGAKSFDALYTASSQQSQKLDKDLNNNFDTGTLVATAKPAGTTSTKLKWKKVAGADGYFVYTNICNSNEKKNKLKKVKDITSASKTSYKKTKLKKNKWYKYRIVAYKNVNGKKMTIGQSLVLHAYTGTKTSKVGNPSKITVKKKTITIKKGKTAKMNAKMVMPKNKKLKKHTAKIRYIVSDTSIATVNTKGKIKAKKKGTCTVYACAQNGVYKAVKIKVK